MSSTYIDSRLQTSMGLTSSLSLVYGSALLPVYFLVGPIVILQGIYAKYFGLDLTVIAMVLLLSRVFDAVTDPLLAMLRTATMLADVVTNPLLSAADYCLSLLAGFCTFLLML